MRMRRFSARLSDAHALTHQVKEKIIRAILNYILKRVVLLPWKKWSYQKLSRRRHFPRSRHVGERHRNPCTSLWSKQYRRAFKAKGQKWPILVGNFKEPKSLEIQLTGSRPKYHLSTLKPSSLWNSYLLMVLTNWISSTSFWNDILLAFYNKTDH